MIEQGHRVAVCDQIQDAREAKGLVDRAVTRVITPGTLVDECLLEESAANLLAAIHLIGESDGPEAVLAAAELSTGSFTLMDLPPGAAVDEVARLAPSELLYRQTDDATVPETVASIATACGCALTPRGAWTFRSDEARTVLEGHFQVAELSGFGLAVDDPGIVAAGALLRYLQETQSPREQPGPGRLAHLQPPRRESPAAFVSIDATSLRALEVERTMRSGETAGSLLATLPHCSTAMGKRLLRQWLCFPRRDRAVLETRQAVVATLVDDRDLAMRLDGHLKPLQDVARIMGRACTGRASPRDIVALGRSLRGGADLAVALEGFPALAEHRRILETLDETLAPLGRSIRDRCVDEPPAHLREGGVFRDGCDGELDDARHLQRDANTWLAAYQKELIEQTGIPSLKVGFNKVFGYYIEVTHVHAGKVPDAFSRKQTLKNAERYVTPQLKAFEDKVTTAQSRAVEREKHLFERLVAEVAEHSRPVSRFGQTVAELDVLACFAETAVRGRYVRPTLAEEPILEIRQGRHAVLDRMLRDGFVPNDCVLNTPGDDGERSTLAIITGPNMAGKSTFIRQVALIVLLAHTGAFVPAEAATVGLVDRIFTRIGASDELHAGRSTFMVEMLETANILHHATDRSLVILDEIGRGTSTLDGLSLAWAIAEALASVRCRTLFATHYHELTCLADQIGSVANLQVAVREWGEEVIFLYRILPGRSDRSYGIHVAKIAGLPPATVRRASELLETFTVHTDESSRAAAPAPPAGGQLGLFTEYLSHPVVDTLRGVDLETMTPLQAFTLLQELRERARD
jgi:DNA mismatch repair protein MutS